MKLLKSAPTAPPIPKQWSNKLPATPIPLHVGPERKVTFLSEAMGVKINRGSDGIVRIVTVEETSQAIVREGVILAGDVIREAAGVDLRRPLTKVMWSDTVALLKISSRPLTLIVAKELSEIPIAVVDELNRAVKDSSLPKSHVITHEIEEEKYEIGKEPKQYSPSPASGMESVADTRAMMQHHEEHITAYLYSPSPASGIESVADTQVMIQRHEENVIIAEAEIEQVDQDTNSNAPSSKSGGSEEPSSPSYSTDIGKDSSICCDDQVDSSTVNVVDKDDVEINNTATISTSEETTPLDFSAPTQEQHLHKNGMNQNEEIRETDEPLMATFPSAY